MCVWKDEIKWKRGRGWPIFRKINNTIALILDFLPFPNTWLTIEHTKLKLKTLALLNPYLLQLLYSNYDSIFGQLQQWLVQ